MAGTITHLVIADQLLKPLQIQRPALFYCGNLAPDAIMAREGYRREMKRHTHFKDGIRLKDLHLPEYYQVYRSTFRTFMEHFLLPGRPDYELYLGYVTHMLADEVFILTLRDAHVQKLKAAGRDPDDPDYFAAFGRDVDLNDWRLVREYAFQYPMPDILLSERDYEIPGYITCEELQNSKAFIIHKNFPAFREGTISHGGTATGTDTSLRQAAAAENGSSLHQAAAAGDGILSHQVTTAGDGASPQESFPSHKVSSHETSTPTVFPYDENLAFINNACDYIQKAIRDCTL